MSTVASAFVCHKVSAHHQFTNGTYFTTSALVLKFSAFSFNEVIAEKLLSKVEFAFCVILIVVVLIDSETFIMNA